MERKWIVEVHRPLTSFLGMSTLTARPCDVNCYSHKVVSDDLCPGILNIETFQLISALSVSDLTTTNSDHEAQFPVQPNSRFLHKGQRRTRRVCCRGFDRLVGQTREGGWPRSTKGKGR